MLSESLHVYMLFLKDVTRSGSNVEMCFFTIFFSEIILTKCSPLSCSNVQYLKLGIYERVGKQKKRSSINTFLCDRFGPITVASVWRIIHYLRTHYASHYFVNYAVKVPCIYFTNNFITKHILMYLTLTWN